jgi:hypothetical protein
MSSLISPSLAWKLVLAAALLAAIAGSQLARAPAHPVAAAELRRLVGCALGLYAVGLAGSLTGHPLLAALVYSAGIAICALASWLARGDSEDPPDGEEPADERPPPEPDGLPELDWARFEAEFAAYSRARERRPVA